MKTPYPMRPALLPVPLLGILFALACPVDMRSQSESGDNLGVAVIVGKNHAWMLEAPERWILDPSGASASGLGAAFRPESESWSKSPAVMYANTILKHDSITLDRVIATDTQRAELRIPKMSVREVEPIGTIQGVDARVFHFVRSDSSLYEAVAYIDCPTAVALVVLSARTGKDFRASLDSFARLVDSYEWITSDPSRISGMEGRW